MSSHRKQKRSIIDELFGSSIFDENEKLFGEFPSSGYSISVVQTPEGTTVKAKVGKDTDADALRTQLKRQYPKAKIEIEGGRKESLIREISTKELENEK